MPVKSFIYLLALTSLVAARTLDNKSSLNNESNEIPRYVYRQNDLKRQAIPSPGETDAQVMLTAANIKNLLSSSPIVQAFVSNTTVQTVLSDPIVQNVLRNPTVQSVLGNNILQNILFDPALQGLAMQTFLSSFTTTTTTPSPPPTTQLSSTTPSTSLRPIFQTQNVLGSPPPSFRPTRRPNLPQNKRPTTQQIIATGIILAIDEFLNVLQSQMAERNRMKEQRIFNASGGRL